MKRRYNDHSPSSHLEKQIEETELYQQLFLRSNLLLNKSQQATLKKAQVAVIGVGGIGGIATEMIARCGLGNIGVADIECFEPSNLNRQLFSNFLNSFGWRRRASDKKASIAAKRINEINPFCQVTTILEGINNNNVEAFCRQFDCIICQPDKESVKVLVHRIAKKYGIPVITASRVNCNGNRWTITAKVWDYQKQPDLPTFEETNHAQLLKYTLAELTPKVCQEYDQADFAKVRSRWREVIETGQTKDYGLIDQADATQVMDEYPDFFHKCHIIAPIANIAGAMASIQAVKIVLGLPWKEYKLDLWNGLTID